jgi:serine/threonine protein kinase
MKGSFPEIGDTVLSRFIMKKEMDTAFNFRTYKAVDTKTDSLVTLKIQLIDESVQPLLPDIKSEAEYFKKCDFPNIVKILDLFSDRDRLIISMHYIEGHSLMSAIKELGTFSPEYVLHFSRELLGGLVSLHEEGIIHQNINPANILFDTKGKVWINDILSSHNYAFTRYKSPKNHSLPYAPPEVYNNLPTDTRWDIYSLGVCMFFGLAGELPDEIRTMFTFGKNQGIDPGDFGVSVPDNLALAIKKATCANPSDRFQTAQSFLETLQSNETPIKKLLFFDTSCFRCLSCKNEVMEERGICSLCKSVSTGTSLYGIFIKPDKIKNLKKEQVLKLKKFLEFDQDVKVVSEAVFGLRPLLISSYEMGSKILLHMKEYGLNGYLQKRSLLSFLPKDVMILISIIFILSATAQFLMDSDHLIRGIFFCIALTYFGYVLRSKPLLGFISSKSNIPAEINNKLIDAVKGIELSNILTLKGRILLISDQLYRRSSSEIFHISRLLLHMCKTCEAISKINHTISATVSVAQSSDHPSQLAEYKRALHKNILTLLKIYELLFKIKLASLIDNDMGIFKDSSIEEEVDKIVI